MALTVTDNSVRQINAALLSLEKKIGETNSEKAQDKQVVQMEIKNVQYNFMAPLHQSGISVSIDTTGTWEGNARSATNAEHAITADNIEHANTATSANLSKTLDTVNGAITIEDGKLKLIKTYQGGSVSLRGNTDNQAYCYYIYDESGALKYCGQIKYAKMQNKA